MESFWFYTPSAMLCMILEMSCVLLTPFLAWMMPFDIC